MKPDLTSNITRVVEMAGQQFSLNIDQMGGLDAEIFDVINGVKRPGDFVQNIQTRLEVEHDTAVNLTRVVNDKIFSALQNDMADENMHHERESSLQELEQAGDFVIERPMSDIPVRKSLNLLEDTAPSVPATVYPKKEPLVEQLLRGSTAIPEQKVVRTAVPPRPAGTDPYREALE